MKSYWNKNFEIEIKKKELCNAKESKLNVKRSISKELELLYSQNIESEDPV